MRIRVLGPASIEGVPPLSPRDRVVLAALVVAEGGIVRADQLAAALYGDEPPPTARKVVQGAIGRLRRALGKRSLETVTDGYRLAIGSDDVDAWQFERLVAVAADASTRDEHGRAAALLREAIELFFGEPLADVDSWELGRGAAGRLAELRRTAEERLLDALLAAGRAEEAAASAVALVDREPLREVRWAALALAQYRCGRQADALRSIHRARQVLRDELGVEPGPALVRLERALLEQDACLDVAGVSRPSSACPYKGLASYGIDDADTFYGRDSEVAACVDRMVREGFLAVVGPSGSGKSSLACAGIGRAFAQRGRSVAAMVPGAAPLERLEGIPPGAALIVDQLEELFTAGVDANEQLAFARALAARANVTPVVVTLRADFLSAVTLIAPLAELIEGSLFLLGPLRQNDLRTAIEGPARRAGLRLEPGLVDLLVRDVVDQPGGLPLLSHALAETWERRVGDTLTVDGYRAGGGVEGAVAATADRVVDQMNVERRAVARGIFLRLVSMADGDAPIRHRLQRTDVSVDNLHVSVLDSLVRSRLVTADSETVELAHEAIVRAWPRLRAWLDEDRDGQRLLRHLSATASEWSSRGRDDADLYRGARLRAAEEWVRSAEPNLTPAEREFLDGSAHRRRQDERDLAETAALQMRANRRLRALLVITAIGLAIALLAGGVAVLQRSRAQREQRAAAASARQTALRDLTSQAVVLRSTKRDLAALLAVEAERLAPGSRAGSALFGTFTAAPGFEGNIRLSVQHLEDGVVLADNTTLAVTDERAAVHLIDLATGSERATLPAVQVSSLSTNVAASGDGAVLAVFSTGTDAANPGRLTVWDLSTRQRRFPDVALPFPSGSVAVNHDGTLVAVSGGPDAIVQVRSASDGTLIAEPPPLQPPPGAVLHVFTAAVGFTPADQLLIGAGAGPIRVVDPRRASEQRRFNGPAQTSESYLRVGSDGRTLITSGGVGVMRWDLSTGLSVWPAPAAVRCNSLALAERAGVVLCGQVSGQVLTFDLSTGAARQNRFDLQQGSVSGLAVSPDGSRLIEISVGAPVFGKWRLDGGGPISRILAAGGEHGVDAYLPDGNLLIDVSTGRPPPADFHEELVAAVTGKLIDPLEGVHLALPTPQPGRLLAAFLDGTTGFYDRASRARVGPTIALPFAPQGLAPDSNEVLAWGGGQLRSIDAVTGLVSGPIVDDPDPIFAAGAPDAGHLLTLGADGLQRRDPRTGAREGPPVPSVSDIALGANRLVAVTNDGQLHLLEPDGLQQVGAPLPGLLGDTQAIILSPDGRRLAVVGLDRTLRLIDVAGRTFLGDPIDLGAAGNGAAISPSGNELAAATAQGVVVWDLDPARWSAAACHLAGRNLTRAEWTEYLGALGPYHQTCSAYPAP